MIYWYLLLAALSFSCVTPSPHENKIAAIDAFVVHEMGFVKKELMPVTGVSVAVYLGNEPLLVKGYGFADLEKQIPVNSEHIFRVGSITKTFTAAGIMSLVEGGKLKLDDPVIKYLPEYPGIGSVITLRQLLAHTSGLDNYNDGADWPQFENKPMSRSEMVKRILGQPRQFKPGDGWYYSNSGFYLLGLVIEKVTGLKYADFVQSRLVSKAGLKNTRYCPTEQDYPQAAKGYAIEKGRDVPSLPLNMDHPYAAGAMCSTANDLVQWILALAKGRIVRPESYKQMITPAVLNNGKISREPGSYGLGLFSYMEEGHPYVGHGGGISGFSNTMDFYPEDGLIVVVQTNTDSGLPLDMATTIAHMFLGITKDLPIDQAEVKPLLGNYEFPQVGAKFRIGWTNGQLFAAVIDEIGDSGPEMRLLSQGGGRYWANEKAMKIFFEKKGEQVEAILGRSIKGSKIK